MKIKGTYKWIIALILWFISIIILLNYNLLIISAAVISAGILSLHFLYQIWVFQPDIKIKRIISEKTFLRHTEYICNKCKNPLNNLNKCSYCNSSLTKQNDIIYKFKAIPTIYLSVLLKNEGKATAKDCFVCFSFKDKIWYGRWGVPDQPERFNLHPGDQRKVHMIRTFISITTTKPIKDPITKLGLFTHKEFPGISNSSPDFRQQNIEIRSEHPRKELVEERGKSKFGGWIGSRVPININERLEINYSISAENWNDAGKIADFFQNINLKNVITDANIWQQLPDTNLINYVENQLKKLAIKNNENKKKDNTKTNNNIRGIS